MRNTFRQTVEADNGYRNAVILKNDIITKTEDVLKEFCRVMGEAAGENFLSVSPCYERVDGEKHARISSFSVKNHYDQKNAEEPLRNYQIKPCTACYNVSFGVCTSGALRQIIFGEEKHNPSIAISKDYVYIDPTGGSHRAVGEGHHRVLKGFESLLDDNALGGLLEDIYINIPDGVKARIDWQGTLSKLDKIITPRSDANTPRTNIMGTQLS